MFKRIINEKKIKRICLVGNPNAGKTYMFNSLSKSKERVGNFPGVTVKEKEKICRINGEKVLLVDLPGVYSLNGFTLEEKVTANYLANNEVDLVINIIDTNSIERSLDLTDSLIKMGLKIVVYLNFYHDFISRGGYVDVVSLKSLLSVNLSISKFGLLTAISSDVIPANKIGIDSSKFGGIIKRKKMTKMTIIDKVLLNKYLAVPIFIVSMLIVFLLTFGQNSIGGYLSNLIKLILNFVSEKIMDFLNFANVPILVMRFFDEAIFSGLFSVLCFLPQISLMYFFMSIFEHSGYIARMSFITDGAMRKIGLNGKAIFPMIMGFGCSASSVLLSRSQENKTLQKKLIYLIPYLSCSAKMPIYLVFASVFFVNVQGLFIFFIYLIGVLMMLVMGFALNKWVIKGEEDNFFMEMSY